MSAPKSLRDWFAGQFMMSFLQQGPSMIDWDRDTREIQLHYLATLAYEAAEVMIDSRGQLDVDP